MVEADERSTTIGRWRDGDHRVTCHQRPNPVLSVGYAVAAVAGRVSILLGVAAAVALRQPRRESGGTPAVGETTWQRALRRWTRRYSSQRDELHHTTGNNNNNER